jgi:inosine-uridine nucleoside N-ribohydrolase
MGQCGAAWAAAFLAALLPAAALAQPAARNRVPVLLDTDIGSDIDDAFALALVLASPELDLRGVTTVGADAEQRARIVCRFLAACGRRDVPVAWGRAPQPAEKLDGQIRYRGRPPLDLVRVVGPRKLPAVAFLYSRLKAEPGKLTVVALGPLTNLARLLREHPDCKPWIRRVVLMGGSLRAGYDGKPGPVAEWNIEIDIPAARAVFASGVPLVVAPLDATAALQLKAPLRRRLFAARTPLTLQVQALYELWGKRTPTLFDPAAVALAFTEKFFTAADLRLEVDEKGFTRVVRGTPNARVATAVRADAFLNWYVERVAATSAATPPR